MSSIAVGTLPVLSDANYNFLGWSLTPGGSVLTSNFPLSADQTLYAQWQIKVIAPTTFTISFNNQGHGGVAPSSITHASTINHNSLPALSDASYNFLGWSLTSSGPVLNSDIALLADQILYAMWQVKPVSPAPSPTTSPNSGGSGAKAIVLPKKAPAPRAVTPRFTTHAVETGLVALQTKFVDITSHSKQVPITHDAGTALKLTNGVQQSLAGRLKLEITSDGLVVTAVNGWTGRTSVPVVATVHGKLVEAFVGVEEDPAPVIKPIFTLIDTRITKVTWGASSSQVLFYNVYLGSKLVCTTNQTSCELQITSINDFKKNLLIEAVGHQTTYSTRVPPSYSQPHAIPAGLVHFAVGSSVLTSTEKLNLDDLISSVKRIGVSTLIINGHADASTGTDNVRLSTDRAESVRKYIEARLTGVKISVKGYSSTVPVKSNATAGGRSDNRRAEILVG